MINSVNAVNLMLSLLVSAELSLVILSLTLYLAGIFKNHLLAFSSSVIFTLAIYSAAIQIILLCGAQQYLPIVEILFALFSIFSLKKFKLLKIDWSFFRQNRLYLLFIPAIAVMFVQSTLLPPLNHDCLTYNIARTSLMNQESALYIQNYNSLRQVMFNVGFDVLNLLYSRFNSDYCLGFVNFMVFLAIVSALIYILDSLNIERKYWIVSIAVIFSNSSFILQASSSKNDIALVACAIVSLATVLSMARTSLNKSLGMQSILLMTISGISFKPTYVSFLLPLSICMLYYFSTSTKTVKQKDTRLSCCVSFVALLTLVHICLLAIFYYHNYSVFGSFLGDKEFASLHRNNNGFPGFLANIIRFSLTLFPVNNVVIQDILTTLHDDIFHLGMTGTESSFSELYRLMSTTHEDTMGVGIFYTLALLSSPFLLFMLKDWFARLLVLSSILTFLSLCYLLSWNPWITRFFPLVVMPMTPIFSILAEKFKFKLLTIITISLSLIIMSYTMIANTTKSLWCIKEAISNRDGFYNKYNPYAINSASLLRTIKGNVLIVADENDPIYQYYILFTNASLKIMNAKHCIFENGFKFDVYIKTHSIDYILNMSPKCASLELTNYEIVASGLLNDVKLYKVVRALE